MTTLLRSVTRLGRVLLVCWLAPFGRAQAQVVVNGGTVPFAPAPLISPGQVIAPAPIYTAPYGSPPVLGGVYGGPVVIPSLVDQQAPVVVAPGIVVPPSAAPPAPGGPPTYYPPYSEPYPIYYRPPRPRQTVYVDDPYADMRGITLMAGVGVEGYPGHLAGRIYPGVAWSGALVFKPTSILGIELGYTGSAAAFVPERLDGGGAAGGATLIRHGAHVAVSVGLSATRVQPYLLAGVGVNRYVLINAPDSGYREIANVAVPLGFGIRTYFVGRFTLDIRGTYSLSFGQSFASGVGGIEGFDPNGLKDIGHWSGMAFAGYTF